jgi:hypothetical protein
LVGLSLMVGLSRLTQKIVPATAADCYSFLWE